MKIKRLAHIGVAVKELAEVERVYTDILPLKKDSEEPLNQLVTSFIPVGETNLELVASTDDNSPIAKFISKKGEGVHHLAFEVDDVYAACEELKEKGVPLTTQEPYDGAHRGQGALHPPQGDAWGSD
jgi:methylmalonyl-CoA epimerase